MYPSRPAILHANHVATSHAAAESAACAFCAASDEGLIDEIAIGRQDALEHFFDRHYRTVFRVALRIVRDEGESQDIAQEVFFQFARNLHLYDQRKGSPRTWIIAIAYHRSLDRRQYLNLRHFYDQVEIDPLKDALLTSLNRPYEPPRLMAEEGIGDAFLALTVPQRETIRLYCFDGLTFGEIAARRKETLSNTRHHYYRALDKIREYLRTRQHAVQAQPRAVQTQQRAVQTQQHGVRTSQRAVQTRQRGVRTPQRAGDREIS